MKATKVKFSQESLTKNEIESMDPDLASRLYKDGGFFILKDLPEATEFGIDMNSWNTGPKFLGVKMIPAGLHFIYYSPANKKDGSLAPRRGFFLNFTPGQIHIRKFDPSTEELLENEDEEEIERMRCNLKNIDGNLGAYPYQSWKKWVSLSNRLSSSSVTKLQPKCSPIISSSTEVTEGEDTPDSAAPDTGTCINYTRIARQKYPAGACPADITRYSIDSSYQLSLFLASHHNIQEVLVELQFSFLCFLVGQNFDSFTQWKQIVAMMCGCGEALLKYPQLFINFISDMHFQMQEVPEDFFVDIVSCNNFLVTSLTDLFTNIKEHEDENALTQLKTRAISFENHLTKKFGWSFEEDEDEFAPVIVYE